jgi:hypothetical protein
LRLNPKVVCACKGFSGTGGSSAACVSIATLKTTHARVAPSQLCICTAKVQPLSGRNQGDATARHHVTAASASVHLIQQISRKLR